MLKFVFNMVSVDNKLSSAANQVVNEVCSHNEKVYLQLLNHKRKMHQRIQGSYQFVPADVWAECLFKTMDEQSISLDYADTYIVNLYCLYTEGKHIKIDYRALKTALIGATKKIYEVFAENIIEFPCELPYVESISDALLEWKQQLSKLFFVNGVFYFDPYQEQIPVDGVKGIKVVCTPPQQMSLKL